MNKADWPIIIYGAPRSGTTYILQILNTHPQIRLSDEVRLFAWLYQAMDVLSRDDRFLFHYRPAFLAFVRQNLQRAILDFYESMFPNHFYWGDKNPHYVSAENRECLSTTLGLFPGAKFIQMVRDGRDVVVSLLKLGWADFDMAHKTWNDHVEIGMEFARRHPSCVHTIRYETLVVDDLAVAQRLFDFLSIALHPHVVDFVQAEQSLRTPFATPVRELDDPLASLWSEFFDYQAQQRSLELLRLNLKRLGYL